MQVFVTFFFNLKNRTPHVFLRGVPERRQSQEVLGSGHTCASLAANWANTRDNGPTQDTQLCSCYSELKPRCRTVLMVGFGSPNPAPTNKGCGNWFVCEPIYRFVVILPHKTERPTSKQMVK